MLLCVVLFQADGSSKREKQLRLDLSAAQRNMQQYQQSVSAYQLQVAVVLQCWGWLVSRLTYC